MTIEVLSLGESIKNYKPNGNTTVGVNDIFKHFPVEHLVLVDPPNRFHEPDRFKTIMMSTPKVFYSNRHWLVPNFKHIDFVSPRGKVDLDSENFSYSNTSTFVAAVLAYKLGAKKINLHGADFIHHSALSKKGNADRILKDFDELYRAMMRRGVEMFCPKDSLLNKILPLIEG